VLSRYDQQIRKYANAFGLDWLLVAALMYEESRFDPSATSAAGALGLLQIMPGTASAMGVADATDPEQNISAGVRYLKYQCDLFEDAPDAEDQVRLALASYTIGAGHVQDAQRLASARGLDPNDWQSVADALRLLSLPEYYRHAEFGYCRGDEVVGHVEEVIRRWEIYGEYLERRGVSESGQALSAAEAQAQNGEPG
jgi:membrane-bound lytic murein transglycosylase F